MIVSVWLDCTVEVLSPEIICFLSVYVYYPVEVYYQEIEMVLSGLNQYGFKCQNTASSIHIYIYFYNLINILHF